MRLLLIFLVVLPSWSSEKHNDYTLMYTSHDKKDVTIYNHLVESGMMCVRTFFKSKYPTTFSIYIHPNRHSLDSTWQKDWNMPDFKSECWMVASGIGSKLDIISPKVWNTEACEHVYSETTKTQQLITHELVHVFHGQYNTSHDFSEMNGIDWFVEGLATYASGQLNVVRTAEVKQALFEKKTASRLDDFWTGSLRYGQSGSIVRYIDEKYGRDKMITLLKYNKKTDLLAALKTTEEELLAGWEKSVSDRD
jgi:hypothetical protein